MPPWAKAVTWIACVCALVGLTLDNTRPYSGDEAFYIASAIGMVRTGDILVPRFDGEVRVQKPIVSYWATAIGYRLFGVRLWSGRVAFLAMAGGLLALVYRFSRLLGASGDLAWLNVALLSSSTLLIESSRVAMTDLPLAFFATLSLYLYCRALDVAAPPAWLPWAAACAAGAAMASKGPFGLIPVAAVGTNLVVDRPAGYRGRVRALLSPPALLAAVGIGVAWHAYLLWSYGPEIAQAAGTEARDVFSLDPRRAAVHAAYYAWVLLAYHGPAVALAAYARFRRGAAWPANHGPLLWLVVVSLAAACLLLERHKARYLLIASPAIAMLAGALIHQARLTAPARRLALAFAGVQVAVLLAYPAVVGRPLNDLVRHWERHLDGPLATSGFDARDASWVNALAGGRLEEDAGRAAFVLVRGEDAGDWPDHRVVRAASELADLGWDARGLATRTRVYLLLAAPGGRASPPER